MGKKRHLQRPSSIEGPSAKPLSDDAEESQTRKKRQALWHTGALFHATRRYPRKPDAPRVDRLACILQRGLVAPACCPEGLVRSDLNLTVTGCGVPYESFIFLHRFGPVSFIYTICEPGRFAVFIDPALSVLTEEEMGTNWPVLCQDEVYVRDGVAAEKLTAVAVHPADADAILRDLVADFQRLAIPLCDYSGNVLWAPP